MNHSVCGFGSYGRESDLLSRKPGAEWTRIAIPTIPDGPISHPSLTLFLQNGSRHRSMFGLGESTSRLGESSSSVRTGHRRLLRLRRRRYLRSGLGRSGAAMRVLSRPCDQEGPRFSASAWPNHREQQGAMNGRIFLSGQARLPRQPTQSFSLNRGPIGTASVVTVLPFLHGYGRN